MRPVALAALAASVLGFSPAVVVRPHGPLLAAAMQPLRRTEPGRPLPSCHALAAQPRLGTVQMRERRRVGFWSALRRRMCQLMFCAMLIVRLVSPAVASAAGYPSPEAGSPTGVERQLSLQQQKQHIRDPTGHHSRHDGRHVAEGRGSDSSLIFGDDQRQQQDREFTRPPSRRVPLATIGQTPPKQSGSVASPSLDSANLEHSFAKSAMSVPSLAANVHNFAEKLASGGPKALRSMGEMAHQIHGGERDTIVLLLATALVHPVMNLFGLSPVLGFLFAGMLLGPAGLQWVSDVETTTKLAELGVVFFLFEMGLELELERLKSVGRDAFTLGTAQFLLTTFLIGSLALKAGATGAVALVLGGGLALSSSAFVIQLLNEKGELASRFGRASFGILLLQDLAVVPLLVVTPLLGGTGAQLGAALRLAVIKSVSALSFIFVFGRYMLQYVYRLVASARDQTSFLAITLVTVLSMAGFTAALGLSDTLGAFLAGVLLAETKYRYQIEADIAPFRGLLLGLFFITTGFAIDLKVAIASWPLILGGTLTLLALKTAITTLVCAVGGLKLTAALRSGLLLSQGGEFSFVIFALAQQHGLLLPTQVKLLLTTVVLTMFLTPFLNELGLKASAALERSSGKLILPSPDEAAEKSNYVLIAGFGRVGQAVAEMLTAKLVRYKAFDMDPYKVAEARKLGLPVFFGDATRPEVLQILMKESEANISSVVVTLDTERDCTKTVRALRRLYPNPDEMPIFVRAYGTQHRRKLMAVGATALETGPQESALLLGGAILTSMGVPQEEVVLLIDEARRSMYSTRLRDTFGDDEAANPLLALLRSPFERANDKAEAAAIKADLAAEAEAAEVVAAAELLLELAQIEKSIEEIDAVNQTMGG
jgi:monovalent cation:H+ antiporter-2, CPA2 family